MTNLFHLLNPLPITCIKGLPLSIIKTLHLQTFNTAPQQVSITDLLSNSQAYHQQLVSVRGLIIQPELHLDETELYLDFVFRLSQGTHSLVVYGRHDRTKGAPPIIINRSVEVIGTFWKEQNRKGLSIFNALEAVFGHSLSLSNSRERLTNEGIIFLIYTLR